MAILQEVAHLVEVIGRTYTKATKVIEMKEAEKL
jgi:hypothetical protein